MTKPPAGIRLAFTAALGLLLAGCSLLPGWGRGSGAYPEGPEAAASPAFVTAVPSYRLLIDTASPDSPSRLLVVHVRAAARAERSFSFGLGSVRLRLADGRFARVFDRERAAVLVRRTRLGAANLSYLHTNGGNHPPGGLPPQLQSSLEDYVLDHLLADGTVRPGEPMEGYVVIDTLEPLSSLDGAVLEATTEENGVAARDTFLFTRTGPVAKDAGAHP
jgi:hypothetical protein